MVISLQESSLLQCQAHIDGQWVDSFSGQTFEVNNPANHCPIATVANCGHQETLAAIVAAYQALPAWKATLAIERANMLHLWHRLILEHSADLAHLITIEGGKPLAESKIEVNYGASFIPWFAEEARRIYGRLIPSPDPQKQLSVHWGAVGVVAAITPWNFPFAMITRKASAALAAGCSLVIKPSEETPLTALALMVLAVKAGFPAGVINILPTSMSAEVGKALATHPLVRKISFTGSTAVGKLLMTQAAGTVKRLSLELGGNAPFLVFDDADIDRAIHGAMAAKFRNTGQACVCVNRFLVQEGIYQTFLTRLTASVSALKLGSGCDVGIQQGPLISFKGLKKVQNHVEDALAKGARLLCGGNLHPLGGTFFSPTVLADITPEMLITQEETFGPVAAVAGFKDEAEAIRLANDTSSGLASYVYSGDFARCQRVAAALDYGLVGINEGLFSAAEAPFGGVKESGLGREGGQEGLMEYLEAKYICTGL